MIQVENLRKSFDGVPVLKGISTVFEKGKTNLIIGQSGSGKTVFLKSLLGLFVPDEGDIIYDGVSYADMKQSERTKLRQKMGMIFQGSASFAVRNRYVLWLLPVCFRHNGSGSWPV